MLDRSSGNTPTPPAASAVTNSLRQATSDIELFEVRIAVEEFLVVRDAIVLDPDVGVVEAVWETADVSLPVAD
jgi:hypothetical protein